MDDSIVVGTDSSDTAKQAVAEAVRLAKRSTHRSNWSPRSSLCAHA
jgi:hypothetical protein